MKNQKNKAPVHPSIAVAGFCATASVGIAAVALCVLHTISDSGMWAIAAMTAAPSAMGVGIAFFISRKPDEEVGRVRALTVS